MRISGNRIQIRRHRVNSNQRRKLIHGGLSITTASSAYFISSNGIESFLMVSVPFLKGSAKISAFWQTYRGAYHQKPRLTNIHGCASSDWTIQVDSQRDSFAQVSLVVSMAVSLWDIELTVLWLSTSCVEEMFPYFNLLGVPNSSNFEVFKLSYCDVSEVILFTSSSWAIF